MYSAKHKLWKKIHCVPVLLDKIYYIFHFFPFTLCQTGHGSDKSNKRGGRARVETMRLLGNIFGASFGIFCLLILAMRATVLTLNTGRYSQIITLLHMHLVTFTSWLQNNPWFSSVCDLFTADLLKDGFCLQLSFVYSHHSLTAIIR